MDDAPVAAVGFIIDALGNNGLYTTIQKPNHRDEVLYMIGNSQLQRFLSILERGLIEARLIVNLTIFTPAAAVITNGNHRFLRRYCRDINV